MPEIRPFRAVHYDRERVGGDLALAVAQPYDKVDERLRAEYLARHGENIVRIDLPREDDPAGGLDRYGLAARRFREWLASGLLARDGRPGFYVYEQEYEARGRRHARRGFVGLVEATDYGEGRVLPHERTFREPKADRMALVRAVRAHLGMCFLIYSDPERRAMRALDDAVRRAGRGPFLELRLPNGDVNRVHAVHDGAAIAAAREAMAGATCVIADGHHRYEMTVAFRREMEAAGETLPGYRYRLAALVNIDEPGLAVLPTHRLLPASEGAPPRPLAEVVAAATPWFRVEPIALSGADPEALQADLERDPLPPARFVCVGRGRAAFRLTLRDDVDPDAPLAAVPASVRRLDLALLHGLWLERGLGIRAGESEHALAYIREPRDGVTRIEEGRAAALILVRPTPVAEVIRVARAGATMPQKSTDFYPKLLSGLLMYDLEDGAAAG